MKCLASLYNKAIGMQLNEDPDEDDINHGIALAELVSYIEEARMDSADDTSFQADIPSSPVQD